MYHPQCGSKDRAARPKDVSGTWEKGPSDYKEFWRTCSEHKYLSLQTRRERTGHGEITDTKIYQLLSVLVGWPQDGEQFKNVPSSNCRGEGKTGKNQKE